MALLILTRKFLRLRYDAPALNGERRLRVLPSHQLATPWGTQLVRDEAWHCEPQPDSWREELDERGNRVLVLHHARIEAELRFELRLETEHTGERVLEIDDPDEPLGAFLLPSAGCDAGPRIVCAVREVCKMVTSSKRTQESLSRAACEWAHGALRYAAHPQGQTSGATRALHLGQGACGEFSHVMIALCRQLRVPARFVSGYSPAEGLMHAWVETRLDGAWQAWDPTHGREARPSCVVVARGRDWRDVVPFEGHSSGGENARLEVFCRSQIIEE